MKKTILFSAILSIKLFASYDFCLPAAPCPLPDDYFGTVVSQSSSSSSSSSSSTSSSSSITNSSSSSSVQSLTIEDCADNQTLQNGACVDLSCDTTSNNAVSSVLKTVEISQNHQCVSNIITTNDCAGSDVLNNSGTICESLSCDTTPNNAVGTTELYIEKAENHVCIPNTLALSNCEESYSLNEDATQCVPLSCNTTSNNSINGESTVEIMSNHECVVNSIVDSNCADDSYVDDNFICQKLSCDTTKNNAIGSAFGIVERVESHACVPNIITKNDCMASDGLNIEETMCIELTCDNTSNNVLENSGINTTIEHIVNHECLPFIIDNVNYCPNDYELNEDSTQCTVLECPIGYKTYNHECVPALTYENVYYTNTIYEGINYISYPTNWNLSDIGINDSEAEYFNIVSSNWESVSNEIPPFALVRFTNKDTGIYNKSIPITNSEMTQYIENGFDIGLYGIPIYGSSIEILFGQSTINAFNAVTSEPNEIVELNDLFVNDLILAEPGKWSLTDKSTIPPSEECYEAKIVAENSSGSCATFNTNCIPDGWVPNAYCGMTDSNSEEDRNALSDNTPEAISVFSISVYGKKALVVKWNPVENADNYKIYKNDSLFGTTTSNGIKLRYDSVGEKQCFVVEGYLGNTLIAESNEFCRSVSEKKEYRFIDETHQLDNPVVSNDDSEIKIQRGSKRSIIMIKPIENAKKYELFADGNKIKQNNVSNFLISTKLVLNRCLSVKAYSESNEIIYTTSSKCL